VSKDLKVPKEPKVKKVNKVILDTLALLEALDSSESQALLVSQELRVKTELLEHLVTMDTTVRKVNQVFPVLPVNVELQAFADQKVQEDHLDLRGDKDLVVYQVQKVKKVNQVKLTLSMATEVTKVCRVQWVIAVIVVLEVNQVWMVIQANKVNVEDPVLLDNQVRTVNVAQEAHKVQGEDPVKMAK